MLSPYKEHNDDKNCDEDRQTHEQANIEGNILLTPDGAGNCNDRKTQRVN
jgi:hypothetical protein